MAVLTPKSDIGSRFSRDIAKDSPLFNFFSAEIVKTRFLVFFQDFFTEISLDDAVFLLVSF